MEFIVILILLFVWFFMIAPFIRLYRASKQWRNVFEQAQRQQQRQQRTANSQPAPPKKKIDPTVGEYVEFTETTEVTTESTGGAGSSTRVETEAQITDITWEDIE